MSSFRIPATTPSLSCILKKGSLESPLSLTFPPAALAWAGLDSDHEEEHSDEDEHDHDDDGHDHDH